MIQLINKSLRILFFGVTPLFLIASGSKTEKIYPNLKSGVYQFELSGLVNQNIIGEASFKNVIETDLLGKEVNSLELSFISKDNSHIEFIICPKSIGLNGIKSGVYKIKNLNQLIHRFNGVYGFADMSELSELPFFVKTGSITVDNNLGEVIVGSLEVKLENANKEPLYINGFFNAKQ